LALTEEERGQRLAVIRKEIDRIDAQVIALLGERARFVVEVGKLKPSVDKVRVPERERQVLERACQLAVEHGIDPSFVEQLYLVMFDYFVDHQQKQLSQRPEESES
jgi:isochorismate pyruvate lyase